MVCQLPRPSSERFTRNRVRSRLLPEIEEACGTSGVENLRAFASAVESLEEELAARTAHLGWELPSYAPVVASARRRSCPAASSPSSLFATHSR